MSYLIKIDNWTLETFEYVIANNKEELQTLIANLRDEDEVSAVTELHGTVYTVATFTGECKD